MAYYFQSELDNLDNATIKEIEEYTQETVADWYLYNQADWFERLRDEEDKVNFLEELGFDLELINHFNLTDIQAIIVAYMFVNDLFSKEYTDGVMELLDEVLL